MIELHCFYQGNGHTNWEDDHLVLSIGPYGHEWAQCYELWKLSPPCGVTSYRFIDQLNIWSFSDLFWFIKTLVWGDVVFCFSRWWVEKIEYPDWEDFKIDTPPIRSVLDEYEKKIIQDIAKLFGRAK